MTGTCLLGAISLERLTYFNTDVHPARRVSLCYTFEHRIAFLRLICGAGLFCYARPEGRRQKAEGRRQKAEGRRQKAEGRRQKAEGRRDFSPDIVS
ncbi:hypothetical protein [Anaplasma phagocytophilum]|uniref:hypothetical protein n=1 Tax=Anaplasma phagocytophilum TaxID=948 RepID=UPI0005F8A76B|nr:hypothetical protein [Anaplasma phagocytophilum]